MEHITAPLSQRANRGGAGPVHVIGAMNDVLKNHPPLDQDARAVLFEHGRIIIYTRHPAAQAKIRQQEPGLLQEVNDTLRRRYGGPRVTSLRCRATL